MGDRKEVSGGGASVVGSSKKSIDDVFKLVEQQNYKMDKIDGEFAEQRLILIGFTNQPKSIAELQSTSSGQSLQAFNKASKNQIAIEKLNQRLLKNFVDISGIPYDKDENISEYISLISGDIGLAITPMDISTCYRLGHITRVNVKGERLPPVIVVEFTRELTKASLIDAMKNFGRALHSADIGVKNHPPCKIYINERLTPYFREVKHEALKFKTNKVMKFVWTNGGVIHGRIDNGTPILSFDSIDDIHFKLSVNQPKPSETAPNSPNPGISEQHRVLPANLDLSKTEPKPVNKIAIQYNQSAIRPLPQALNRVCD